VSRYETTIDLDNPNNSQTQLITLVGRDQTVLDVGCASGDTAAALKDRGCTVSGVDIDAKAAEPARGIVEELVIADIDRNPLSEHFKAESFDAIIFGDVLEHLLDPWAALRDAVTLLRPGGRILVSIPNVAHASVRLALLLGRWDYTEKGLLDRTHLRFFTLETVCELLESADLQIEVLSSTVLDPMAVQEIRIDAARLPATVIEWARQQPDALSYQYVASARPLAPGEERGRRPALRPAIAYDAARLQDQHTKRMQAEQEERHRALTQRDHIIGLQATTKATENRYSLMRTRVKRAERRYRELRDALEALIGEIEQISDSRRPRNHIKGLVDRLRADNRKRDRDIAKDEEG
jgi:2-polyprenyl-3-methyl-5-hydroxy-6-metoxy-1,4-benzoquinol methylase